MTHTRERSYKMGMEYSFKRDGYENWLLVEDVYQEDYLGKTESVFTLGNGYLAVRSSNEEKSINKVRNMFLSGVFNKAAEEEVSELANLPDLVEMIIKVDGKMVPFNEQTIVAYHKELNIKDGILYRAVDVKTDTYTMKLQFERFVSLCEHHLLGQKVTITIDRPAKIQVLSGIDGQVSNSGCQHFDEGKRRLYGNTMQQIVTTNQSDIKVALNTEVKVNTEVDQLIVMERRKIYKRIDFTMAANTPVEVEKLAYVCSSIDAEYDKDQIGEQSRMMFESVAKQGYVALRDASMNAWQAYWQTRGIEIDGFAYGQLAIRYGIFQLRVHTNVNDERMNIGAKGMSGEGYKGHAFWDTEIFMLPYFIFTDPEAAKKLVKYRYLGLQGAHKKAKSRGYEGAMYPWESAWPEDGEVTPEWGPADIVSGKPIKIESGFLQQHITSDVIYGLWLYCKITGDHQFMSEFGYEMILDTAKFWLSRVEQQDDQYVIRCVMGPNEYKEYVDNDAFTNYMAKWNLDMAIKYIERYDLSSLLETFEISLKQLREVRDHLYLPKTNANHILPENDTFLSLRKIDLTKYKNQENVNLIFEDYNLHQVQELQVCKQADVLILFLLLEDLFTKQEKLANFDFYEPLTLHDSSLSLSTHAVLAADLDEAELAYKLYEKSLDIDLGQNMKTSDAGIHIASYGGMWQSIVYGFGGVRFTNDQLRIEPKLPSAWQGLKFHLIYRGQLLYIMIQRDCFTISNKGMEEVVFVNNGQTYKVDGGATLSI